MKKRLTYVLVLLLVVSLILPGCSTKKEQEGPKQIVLRIGSAGQTTLPAVNAGEKFTKLVTEKSNGRIKVEFYPARQLGDDAELLEQVMAGTLDGGVISTSTFSKYTPLLETLQLPFLLNSYEKEYQAVKSKEMQDIYKALEAKKLKLLSVYDNGIRHFANNTRPINSTADLKGLKLRVVPSNLILNTMKSLGANPTPMAYGEVYTGLQTKVIDGEEINLTSIYSEKHYEVLKYVSTIGLWPFPATVVINLDVFNKLSPEDQKLLQDCANEGLDYSMTLFKEAEDRAIKTMNEKGVKINEIQDVKPFVDATAGIYDEYMAKDPLIKSFVEMARKLK